MYIFVYGIELKLERIDLRSLWALVEGNHNCGDGMILELYMQLRNIINSILSFRTPIK